MTSISDSGGRKKRGSFYDLKEVKDLIRKGKVRVQGNAKAGAKEAFGWTISEILDALLDLEPRHFYKSDVWKIDRSVVLDFYKARDLKEVSVYTHFYINDETGFLVISSFKEI